MQPVHQPSPIPSSYENDNNWYCSLVPCVIDRETKEFTPVSDARHITPHFMESVNDSQCESFDPSEWKYNPAMKLPDGFKINWHALNRHVLGENTSDQDSSTRTQTYVRNDLEDDISRDVTGEHGRQRKGSRSNSVGSLESYSSESMTSNEKGLASQNHTFSPCRPNLPIRSNSSSERNILQFKCCPKDLEICKEIQSGNALKLVDYHLLGYHAQIHPQLRYACRVWMPYCKKYLRITGIASGRSCHVQGELRLGGKVLKGFENVLMHFQKDEFDRNGNTVIVQFLRDDNIKLLKEIGGLKEGMYFVKHNNKKLAAERIMMECRAAIEDAGKDVSDQQLVRGSYATVTNCRNVVQISLMREYLLHTLEKHAEDIGSVQIVPSYAKHNFKVFIEYASWGAQARSMNRMISDPYYSQFLVYDVSNSESSAHTRGAPYNVQKIAHRIVGNLQIILSRGGGELLKSELFETYAFLDLASGKNEDQIMEAFINKYGCEFPPSKRCLSKMEALERLCKDRAKTLKEPDRVQFHKRISSCLTNMLQTAEKNTVGRQCAQCGIDVGVLDGDFTLERLLQCAYTSVCFTDLEQVEQLVLKLESLEERMREDLLNKQPKAKKKKSSKRGRKAACS